MTLHWLKLSALMASATSLWLASHVPQLGRLLQGACLIGAGTCAVVGATESKRLLLAERKLSAERGIDLHLYQQELAFAAAAMEQAIMARYFPEDISPPVDPSNSGTSPEEVALTSREVLERSYSQGSPPPTSQLPDLQPLREAVKIMLSEGKSKTWITENVLGLRGKKFDMGAIDRLLGDPQNPV
jgi:hypothetical protein